MTILSDAVRRPSECVETLAVLAPALDAAGVTWWIDYGTLLGHARDGGMIAWDSDIDLGVLASDREAVCALAPWLKAQGLDACYHPPGARRFEAGDWFHVTRAPGNPNGVDLFFWEDAGYDMLDRARYCEADISKGRAFHRRLLLPLQRVTWEGVEVWAPASPGALAAHRYGATWRDPIDYHGGVQ